MVKLLTRLKISEVSAVDRGAGEDCRILLRKRDQDVTKATAALKESVEGGSIFEMPAGRGFSVSDPSLG